MAQIFNPLFGWMDDGTPSGGTPPGGSGFSPTQGGGQAMPSYGASGFGMVGSQPSGMQPNYTPGPGGQTPQGFGMVGSQPGGSGYGGQFSGSNSESGFGGGGFNQGGSDAGMQSYGGGSGSGFNQGGSDAGMQAMPSYGYSGAPQLGTGPTGGNYGGLTDMGGGLGMGGSSAAGYSPIGLGGNPMPPPGSSFGADGFSPNYIPGPGGQLPGGFGSAPTQGGGTPAPYGLNQNDRMSLGQNGSGWYPGMNQEGWW